jgi:hypothetical protein
MVAIDASASLESFRRFVIASTCSSYMPRSYIEDPEVFPEREESLGSIYVEAADKVTLKKIRDITFVNARDVLGIIYNSKSGNTTLKWRQLRRRGGKVTGEASSNSLVNLAEGGVITPEWVDSYLKNQKLSNMKSLTEYLTFNTKTPIAKSHKIETIDGIDSGGEDGIYVFIKSKSMQQILGQSKLAKISSILEEVMIRANNKSRKFTMGFEETKKANEFGAVESLVFSEKIIQTHDEDEVVEFLNDVESKGVKVYALDASTDIGLQVSGLGGILSLLRFAVDT